MSKDIRVLIIKLSDRLHNLRTIDFMKEEKIIGKSNETLEIYAPLAGRLGMYNMKFELEDIALKHMDPVAFQLLKENVSEKKEERQKYIDKRRSWLVQSGVHVEEPSAADSDVQSDIGTQVWVAADGRCIGRIRIADAVKPAL